MNVTDELLKTNPVLQVIKKAIDKHNEHLLNEKDKFVDMQFETDGPADPVVLNPFTKEFQQYDFVVVTLNDPIENTIKYILNFYVYYLGSRVLRDYIYCTLAPNKLDRVVIDFLEFILLHGLAKIHNDTNLHQLLKDRK